LLSLAAAVEARSEHPLARAILHSARDLRLDNDKAEGFADLPGMGARATVGGAEIMVGNTRLFVDMCITCEPSAPTVERLEAEGNTVVLVGTPTTVLGAIALADTPRPEAASAIRGLRDAGVQHVAMLTGDNTRTAQAIATSLGLDAFRAQLLPEEKMAAVQDLRAQYGTLAMLGDGVNDAPALATADVGVAMGVAGTDAALEVADVALMSDNLSRLEYAILLSRRAVSVIRTNIAISIAVKVLALLLAGFGTLPLWAAILADTGVSLLVTLNGMTLLMYNGKRSS
jgi:Cd2+/Zn2+-exporting ATPase